MQSTARNFWKIACDRKCGVLVMLCDLVETGKVGGHTAVLLWCSWHVCVCVQETCYQYWPSSGSLTVGEFTVDLIQEERLSGFTIRNFGVYDEKVSLLLPPLLQLKIYWCYHRATSPTR